MKKRLRLTSSLLAVCMLLSLLPSGGVAAGGGTTHVVADNQSVLALFTQGKVKDGDTIQITGNGAVLTANDAPWIIDKNVTITGGAVVLRAGGIVLGADVTFKDTRLSFSDNVRNAIAANGHTLTLENVACDNFSFNLFCGGLIKSSYETFQVPAPGNVGTIHIKGNTTLQKDDTYGSGNIYAGNLCMGGMDEANNGPDKNGPANVFAGRAVINIEGGDVGTVYACGAQQRIPVGAPNGKVTLPDAARYTVSGSVTVNGNAPDVEGAGAKETHVNYRNDSGYAASRTFSSLSSLSVETGNLELKVDSYRLEGCALSLSGGAKLNFKALAGRIPTLGAFNGGGILILGENQTLPISGTVTGTARVAIGHTNYDDTQSTAVPVREHCYIQAPNSQDGAFVLLPYATQPDMALVRGENGNWTIPVATEEDSKLQTIAPADQEEVSGKTEILVPLNTTYTGNTLGIDAIPLTIRVNGAEAVFHADDSNPYYEASGLHMYIGDRGNGDELQIYAATSFDDPIPDNVYRIEIVVPGAYTASGSDLTASFTLTVGDVPPPPEHQHSWSGEWNSNATHHWHNCMGENCPIREDNQKEGYAAHTPGEWVIDKAPTATQDGSRHRSCTVCGHETARETIPATGETPEHRHSWSGEWSSDAAHHWHECTGGNCPIQDNSQKEGYAAHTPGEWIIDKAPTATQDGSRHKSCTVCGYETARETIPATGGGSSGGGSSGGGSSGGSSSSSNTVHNPDGSSTTTRTDRRTGTVTETTRRPDGTTVTVETRKDGTVTTTEKRTDGSTGLVSTDKEGRIQAQVELSQSAVKAAGEGAVVLPLPGLTAGGGQVPTVEIALPKGTDGVRVEIPVARITPGTVILTVDPEGTETVVKKSAMGEGGITLTLTGSTTLKLTEAGMAFSDLPAGSWAGPAAEFVSARGIFQGTAEGVFSPDIPMTRGMLAMALYKLEDNPDCALTGAFTDVGEGWYADAVHWAAEQGLVQGHGNGRFSPNEGITREQLVTILWRYAGSPAAAGELTFPDAGEASGYAREALRWAQETGIIQGDGQGLLQPRQVAIRAQVAQMLMNFIQSQY